MIALWAKFKFYAVAVGAALAAAFVAYWRIREDGKNAIRQEQDRRRLEAIKNRKDSDDEIHQMDDATVDSGLAKWLRDHP